MQRPVLILGRLDGVETGVRNLIRRRPLEVEQVQVGRRALRVPTLAEICRVKAWLCLIRNATRDYLDFAALAARLGEDDSVSVVLAMDDYYSDQIGSGGRRVATQVARQLAQPVPDDLSTVDLASYRKLERRWQNWQTVADWCRRVAVGGTRSTRRTANGRSMIHRHCEVPPDLPAEELPLVAINARLSTLQAYARALGGRLLVTFVDGEQTREIRLTARPSQAL